MTDYEKMGGGSVLGGKLDAQVKAMTLAINEQTETICNELLALGVDLSRLSLFSVQGSLTTGVAVDNVPVWHSYAEIGIRFYDFMYFEWILSPTELLDLIGETSHATVPS